MTNHYARANRIFRETARILRREGLHNANTLFYADKGRILSYLPPIMETNVFVQYLFRLQFDGEMPFSSRYDFNDKAGNQDRYAKFLKRCRKEEPDFTVKGPMVRVETNKDGIYDMEQRYIPLDRHTDVINRIKLATGRVDDYLSEIAVRDDDLWRIDWSRVK